MNWSFLLLIPEMTYVQHRRCFGNSSAYSGAFQWMQKSTPPNTWLRLRDYTPAPLIQEYHEDRGHSPSTGSPLTDYYVQITPFGVAFYERAFLRYQELYPA